MLPPKTIRTERLILRQPTLDDAQAVFETYAQDTEVTRFLTWRPHSTIGETKDFLQSRLDAWRKQSGFMWAITLLDQILIGAIALRVHNFKADAGYVIARPFWNQGYATEALQAVVDWALTQAQIHRVWAVCDVDNMASARVLEKVGMAREGILRRWIMHPNISDKPRDCLCYAIVKSQNWAPTSEPMNDFEHIEGGIELLDSVAPLWEHLKRYHVPLSAHFGDFIATHAFAEMKKRLIDLSRKGEVRIYLVRIKTSSENIGYCIASITGDRVGKIESLFVEDRYREQGIGDGLMRRAMQWMDAEDVTSRTVTVLCENDRAHSFYQRYGFHSYVTQLRQQKAKPGM